ncbi:MAG TPA: hypothetical protein VFN87_02845 [Solirubrobacteraceae bacterium]|nr:hypothetical protein [Solirubrobacteraceae bacterium]
MLAAERSATTLAAGEVLDGALAVGNLLGDLDSLAGLLERAASAGLAVDAFLAAAAVNQIVEDRLHDAPYPFDDAAALLAGATSPAARLAGRASTVSGSALRRLRAAAAAQRRMAAAQPRLAGLVAELAAGVLGTGELTPALAARCAAMAAAIPAWPERARRSILHLPACFYTFDQRPEDLGLLADRFIARRPDTGRPLLVVGVRTSGSYLAPLLRAALRARGRPQTGAMTMRPRRALLAWERAAIRAHVARHGEVLLIDDPPVTGRSLAMVATELEALGVLPAAITVVLAVDRDSPQLPERLGRYEGVVLAVGEWTARRRLTAAAAAPALAELLRGELEVRSVTELPLGEAVPRRGHARRLLRVEGADSADGTPRQVDVLATAVGVGYLGAHHAVVAQALHEFAPRTLGLRDGVLYREWLAAERRLPADAPQLPAAVAAYVAARRRILGVSRDMTVDMTGEGPVWEVAGALLAQGFARAAPAARVLLANRAARRLLTVAQPSVSDGDMAPGQWFAGDGGGGGGSPLKVGLTERTYWHLGLACCDAAFDLAGAPGPDDDGRVAAAVRAAWHTETGEDVDPERWLLYELAHQWGRRREQPGQEAEIRRAGARSAARYFAQRFLADLGPGAPGPVCALDIDGVLESEALGFPALTRAGALALRALRAHGYVVVPVTGRGREEVRDRCRAYGLIAGVAEYGAVLCLDGGTRAVCLLDEDARHALDRLRESLRAREPEGIRLDPAFAHAVRAYRLGPGGARRPLTSAEADACLTAGGPAARARLRAIRGDSQTDFVAAAVDKGTGVRALLAALAEDPAFGGRPDLALAVGDSAADVPMLTLGRAAYVPAHAPAAASAAGARRTTRPYQAGLAQAVGALLGHPPGGCEQCRAPQAGAAGDLLLDLLSVSEGGRRGLVPAALRVAWRLR